MVVLDRRFVMDLRSFIPSPIAFVAVLAFAAIVSSDAPNPLPDATDINKLETRHEDAAGAARNGAEIDIAPAEYAGQISHALERPLFSETRRPPEPIVAVEPELAEEPEMEPEPDLPIVEEPPPPVPPDISYIGFLRSGDETEALIIITETRDERWVSLHQQFLGWTVAEISETHIRFAADTVEHVVEINR